MSFDTRPQPRTSLGSCRGLFIVLVDDDQATRYSLAALLRFEGAAVAAASSVDDAWKHIKAKKPDIVLTDVSMPDKDGFELLALIRQSEWPALREVPVIAVSGHGSESLARTTHAAGFSAQLMKPIIFEQLTDQIAALSGSRRTGA